MGSQGARGAGCRPNRQTASEVKPLQQAAAATLASRGSMALSAAAAAERVVQKTRPGKNWHWQRFSCQIKAAAEIGRKVSID